VPAPVVPETAWQIEQHPGPSLRSGLPPAHPPAASSSSSTSTRCDTSGMLPTWTKRAPFDRRVGNPNVAKGTVALWSFLS